MNTRLVILLALLLVLTATVALVYTYPQPHAPEEDRQRTIVLEKWRKQALKLLATSENGNAELMAIRILHSAPGDLTARRILGRVAHDRGEFQRAEAVFQEILTTAPEDAFSHNNYGLLLLRRGESEAGFRELLLASQLMPEQPLVRYNLLRAAELLKRPGFPAAPERPVTEDTPDLLFLDVDKIPAPESSAAVKGVSSK